MMTFICKKCLQDLLIEYQIRQRFLCGGKELLRMLGLVKSDPAILLREMKRSYTFMGFKTNELIRCGWMKMTRGSKCSDMFPGSQRTVSLLFITLMAKSRNQNSSLGRASDS